MTHLHWLTAEQIRLAYEKQELSPVELTRALLDRIDQFNPRCSAFSQLDYEGALQAAQAAEQRMLQGCRLGPMDGIPVGVKDNIDMADFRTACYSKITRTRVARRDAPPIDNLRAAGAILLGKVALYEFGFGGPADEYPVDPTPACHHPDPHPRGASSGSGLAIGAGFVPLVVGTDTAGSIRGPAGACGGTGLKPTYDLVSRKGSFPLAFSLDRIGPLGRSAQDIALALDALVGRERRQSAFFGMPEGGYGANIRLGVRGLRIGVVKRSPESESFLTREDVCMLDQAVAMFQDAGASVVSVEMPHLQEMEAVTGIIWLAEAWAIHSRWLRVRPQDYTPATRRKVMAGAFLTAGDYERAQQARTRVTDAVNLALCDVDVLMTASPFEPLDCIDDSLAYARNYPRRARSPFNSTGHPILAQGCGISDSGYQPASLQFISRAYGEATLLRVAAAYGAGMPSCFRQT